VQDSCCFNAPGGDILMTQFWDTDPSTGPSDSWTIHGLWYVFDSSSQIRLTHIGIGLITAMGRMSSTATITDSTRTSARS
jgi:ribonuclease T2